jgi:hypothetical protein
MKDRIKSMMSHGITWLERVKRLTEFKIHEFNTRSVILETSRDVRVGETKVHILLVKIQQI